jgi:glycosyltransferase involved in cell wall biosynthesis
MSPVLITGMHGGGTSLVTKMLRYCGMFVGADSGPKEARKWHESDSIKEVNAKVLRDLWGNDVLQSKEIENHKKYRSTFDPDWFKKYTEQAKNAMESYWGNTGNRPDVWGFKDPRISITLPLWHEVFPDAKCVIIQRQKKPLKVTSPSGRWFKGCDKRTLQDYVNPLYIRSGRGKIDHKKVQFEELVSDYKAFNELLEYVGLDTLTKEQYNKLLQDVKYQPEKANTFALNLLASKGEYNYVNRLLESLCADQLFDEIVLVLDNKEEWAQFEGLKKKYKKLKLLHFEWCDDFAKSRNYAQDNTQSDYIMFCDADDIVEWNIKPEKLREKVQATDKDVIIFPYKVDDYEHMDKHFPIWKRGTHWRWPCHEYLDYHNKTVDSDTIEGVKKVHMPDKKKHSSERNLRIMRKAISGEYKGDARLEFYYGRELLLTGDKKGFDVLKKLLDKDLDNEEACLTRTFMARYLMYEYGTELKTNNLKESHEYLVAAIQYFEGFGEPYYLLGNIERHYGNHKGAMRLYEEATKRHQYPTRFPQSKLFTLIEPCISLSSMYLEDMDYARALLYHNAALRGGLSKRHGKLMYELRSNIVNGINAEMYQIAYKIGNELGKNEHS